MFSIKTFWLFTIFVFQTRSSTQKYIYDVKTIDVPLDHFSFTNNNTFKLRYLINDSYWNSDGPVFFYTGNEGDIETFAQNSGFVWEIAIEFQARVVFAEHRYYGESLPFGNKSFSDLSHVGYLSSSQALADYVYLLNHLEKSKKHHTSFRNPVIAFGGSYGGMLSAWFRMKYPAIVTGAIAASAPIWQFQDLVPCGIYNEILTSVYSITHHECAETIEKSWFIIRNFSSTSNGKQWLSANWKLCTSLENQSDVENLIGWLTEVYSNLAMTNYPYPTSFLAPLPAHPVRVFCDTLQNISSKADLFLSKLGKALSVYTNYTGDTKCVRIDQTSEALGEEGWDFQACTEMIMPMCSTNKDMFENEAWNFTKYSQACYEKWKIRMTSSDLAILEYGGKDLESFSNIVFSNGLLDPWSGGGVLEDISRSVLAILIPDGAHHLDLRGSNYNDPGSVVSARNFHRHNIRKWLRAHYINMTNSYYE